MSLVVGVVLAVVSVVVASVVPAMRATYKRPPDFARHFAVDGHLVVIGRSDGRMATLWEIHSMPQEFPGVHRLLVREWGASQAASAWWPKGGRTPLDGYYREQFVDRAGWPLRCAYATGIVEQHGFLFYDPPVLQFLFAKRERTIPVLPLWPGLLGNTLFYAALVLTPLALLRRRKLCCRARRGLCVACGYELGVGVGEGIDACPECGLAKRGRPTSKPLECARTQEGVDMNLSDLERILQQEGFNPDIYSLSGGNANDTLCLGQEDGRWCVYYTERGSHYDKRWFDSEGEACEYLLLELRALPRSQSHPPEAPQNLS